jgi:hypothetical protein
MYFMQRITWSGVAMHQGVVPNGPASHGCIRLPEAFARQMWGITKLGARVIVTYGDVTPVAIANDRLFTFKPEVKPEAPPQPEATPQPEASSADKIKAAYGILETAQLQPGMGNTTASDASKSPWDAAKPGDRALDAMAYAIGAPRQTAVTAPDPKPAAAGNPRVANTATNTTVDELRPLKPGPVSVFISRKEGKLFVRKGFEPVFDVPVTFEQPDQPLGTHVFTALALKDDTTLRWHVMSMPGGGSAPAKKAEKGKKVEVAVTTPASNATDALNRVNIPQDAIDRISRLMSPGASLIISDKGISGETGKGTDFIVLTR